MMGRREGRQGQFFYSFNLDQVVPADHLVRQIDGVLDLAWVHQELAPYYSHTGRPSIDPVLMIRMLIVGYVFAIRSERRLCAEVQVNLAYRWFLQAGHRRQDSRSFGVLPSEAYYNRICVDPRSCCARAVALGSTVATAAEALRYAVEDLRIPKADNRILKRSCFRKSPSPQNAYSFVFFQLSSPRLKRHRLLEPGVRRMAQLSR